METAPTNPDPVENELDAATAQRLARLRTMPVDTAALERRLLAQVPRPEEERRSLKLWWLGPLRAVAACLLVAGIVAGLMMATSGGPALASASQMAQLHYDLVSGKTPVMQVDSVEAANRMLAGQWPRSPQIPNMPARYEMACCMKSIKDKKVACVLLRGDPTPVTVTVANAGDMKLPTAPTVTRSGVTYHVESSGALNMVMTERNGRWVCLIGQMDSERLMDLADKMQF
jgi:hypothetical protein